MLPRKPLQKTKQKTLPTLKPTPKKPLSTKQKLQILRRRIDSLRRKGVYYKVVAKEYNLAGNLWLAHLRSLKPKIGEPWTSEQVSAVENAKLCFRHAGNYKKVKAITNKYGW